MNMKRTALNIAIDSLAALTMLAMIATGILIRFTLPPGSGRISGVWGLTRHQWGDLHFWLALAIVAIIVLHLALHWAWVVSVVRSWFVGANRGAPDPRLRAVAAVATVTIVTLALIGFWWTSVRATERLGAPASETTSPPFDNETIRGNMTLSETAAALNCSVDQIKLRLGLPKDVKDSDRLGQIARQRGTTMQEMRRQLAP
jgi:hypothetical protein